jgi:hypothetical protein
MWRGFDQIILKIVGTSNMGREKIQKIRWCWIRMRDTREDSWLMCRKIQK